MPEAINVGLGAECGDNVYAWPVLKALGGASVFNIERPWTRPNWVKRSVSLKQLAESQPYIHGFWSHSGEPLDYDLTTYRTGGHRYGERITKKIARWARVIINDNEPWISVEPDSRATGRIIVARGPRWHGYKFPWKPLVDTFRNEMLFVGTDEEFKAFCAKYGFIERIQTKDLFDVTRLIAGSELFIGSQSCPFAICEGLKHNAVLEVCSYACDCIHQRDNIIHHVYGDLSFNACGKEFRWEEPLNRGTWQINHLGTLIQSREFHETELMARALSIVKQEPISVSDLRNRISQESSMPLPLELAA